MKRIVFIRNVVDHWEGWDLQRNETYTNEWWWWYTTEFHALPRIWNNWTGALLLHNHTNEWPTELSQLKRQHCSDLRQLKNYYSSRLLWRLKVFHLSSAFHLSSSFIIITSMFTYHLCILVIHCRYDCKMMDEDFW